MATLSETLILPGDTKKYSRKEFLRLEGNDSDKPWFHPTVCKVVPQLFYFLFYVLLKPCDYCCTGKTSTRVRLNLVGPKGNAMLTDKLDYRDIRKEILSSKAPKEEKDKLIFIYIYISILSAGQCWKKTLL